MGQEKPSCRICEAQCGLIVTTNNDYIIAIEPYGEKVIAMMAYPVFLILYAISVYRHWPIKSVWESNYLLLAHS